MLFNGLCPTKEDIQGFVLVVFSASPLTVVGCQTWRLQPTSMNICEMKVDTMPNYYIYMIYILSKDVDVRQPVNYLGSFMLELK